MAKQGNTFDQIINSLSDKATLKMDVIQNVDNAVNILKSVLRQIESDISSSISKIDKRLVVKYHERGQFDLEFKISDDILIFSIHTDAYLFPENHQVWKTTYVQENRNRAFCGMISIYNFLTDSLKYNRGNDQGIMIARVFINSENHFFVEGKKQLGFLFNDFDNAVIDEQAIRAIAESAILHCLEFDVLTPPFDQVKLISVQELIDKSLSSVITTGKRLGFKLQSDTDLIQ